MDRRVFLGTVVGGLLVVPHVGQAQPAANVPRIGYLSYQSSASHLVEVFLQGLRELGYFEGQNIVVEYRWAQGDLTRLSELAADLVRRNVRLIVASGNREITAAKAATSTIPIVMVVAVDPVGVGFVASIARRPSSRRSPCAGPPPRRTLTSATTRSEQNPHRWRDGARLGIHASTVAFSFGGMR